VFLDANKKCTFIIKKILYLPCMVSICKQMAKSTCYKIMFVMGVIGIAAILFVGHLTGYLGYLGYVYCSSPEFIYFAGAFVSCLYIF